MQIQAAAEDIVAAGDDHGSSAAISLLYLIERQVHRADDRDIDRVAHRRALYRESRNSVGNRKRQSIHALISSSDRQPYLRDARAAIMPPTNRRRKQARILPDPAGAVARERVIPHTFAAHE
jgi:hypothetical protein